jgi:hypothetical protein
MTAFSLCKEGGAIMDCVLLLPKGSFNGQIDPIRIHIAESFSEFVKLCQSLRPVFAAVDLSCLQGLDPKDFELLVQIRRLSFVCTASASGFFDLYNSIHPFQLIPADAFYKSPRDFLRTLMHEAVSSCIEEIDRDFAQLIQTNMRQNDPTPLLRFNLATINFPSFYVLLLCASQGFSTMQYEKLCQFSASLPYQPFLYLLEQGEIVILSPTAPEELLTLWLQKLRETEPKMEYCIGVSDHISLNGSFDVYTGCKLFNALFISNQYYICNTSLKNH